MTSTSMKRSKSRRPAAAGLVAGALALWLALPGEAEAGAKATIERVVAQALEVLRDASLSEDDKQRKIEEIARERFDFPRITKLVLGHNYKKLSEQQREQFLVEFRRHLSLTYGRRLRRFTDEEVEVGGVLKHSNGDVTVKTVIAAGYANGIGMDYRMRERDGEWYAIDLVIEGVSMISNVRSQVQEIVSSRGADGLIDTLRKKNDKGSHTEPS